jgi:hypothetical protein
MMHFRGFKSKAALKARVKAASLPDAPETRVSFERYAEETSLFGAEYKPGVVRSYCVCMDHPKRSKFANITVDADGYVTKVA